MKRTYLFPIFGVFLFTSCCKDALPDLQTTDLKSDLKTVYNESLNKNVIYIDLGQTVNLNSLIENVKDGETKTEDAGANSVKIKLESFGGAKRYSVDSLYSVPQLSAGQSYSWNPKVTFTKDGKFKLNANLDFLNEIAERNEDNNIIDILSLIAFGYQIFFGGSSSKQTKSNLSKNSELKDVEPGEIIIIVSPSKNPSKRYPENQKIAYFN